MSKKQITVCVTAEDIKKGQPTVMERCPVARAVKRHSTNNRVKVGVESVRFNGENYPLPPKAQRFIEEVDTAHAGGRIANVKPFKFHLLVSKR